jgi:beta-lactamase superfamily II metal-dependent hydrolase
VNVLKVGHHGSERNHTARFFKAITADTYVISANGKYDNPDYNTLTWIVEAAKSADRKIEIVVTNATDSTKKLRVDCKPANYGYTLTVKPKADHSIPIPLS